MGLREFAEDEISTCVTLGYVTFKDNIMSYSSFKSKLLQKEPMNFINHLKTEESVGFLWCGEQTAEYVVDSLRISCEFRERACNSEVQFIASLIVIFYDLSHNYLKYIA